MEPQSPSVPPTTVAATDAAGLVTRPWYLYFSAVRARLDELRQAVLGWANLGRPGAIPKVSADAGTLEESSLTDDGFGTVTQKATGDGVYSITAPAGFNKALQFRTAGALRWSTFANNTAEAGANAGSNLQINRFNDAGTFLAAAFFVERSTGNIGVNTTTPGRLVHLLSNSAVTSPGLAIESTDAGGKQFALLSTCSGSSAGAGKLGVFDGTAGLFRMLFDGLNVGIGTIAPKSYLQLGDWMVMGRSTGGGVAEVNCNIYYDGANFRLIGAGGGTLFQGNNAGDYHIFTSPAGAAGAVATLNERVTILQAGDVGIGVSPAFKLDVLGTVNTTTHYRVAGTQVVGARQAAVAAVGAAPAAYSQVYEQTLATAINALISRLQTHGLTS